MWLAKFPRRPIAGSDHRKIPERGAFVFGVFFFFYLSRSVLLRLLSKLPFPLWPRQPSHDAVWLAAMQGNRVWMCLGGVRGVQVSCDV